VTADALIVEFEVGAPADQAFDAWTQRCSMWWPPAHTISGEPSAITFEPRPGGRIVELASSGVEHEWGTVLDWEPPRRLRYLWHLFFDASEATEVEVTFTPVEDRTAVRLEQTGWGRLGDAGPGRRTRTSQVWSQISGLFTDYVSA
jgi:uncharacterized protein YndB with AHSA1/START domain